MKSLIIRRHFKISLLFLFYFSQARGYRRRKAQELFDFLRELGRVGGFHQNGRFRGGILVKIAFQPQPTGGAVRLEQQPV